MTEQNTDADTGLTEAEAGKRLALYGPNQLSKPYEVKFAAIVKEEISEPMIMLLLVVGFFYTLWGKLEDALTIIVVILLLVFVEVWNEYRAKKSISALTKIAAPKTKVLRDGALSETDTANIVPGDVLILAPGTRITGDGKIVVSYSLQVDESSLTGESFPVDKNAGDEIFAGTLVLSGEGKAVVEQTGKNAKIGKIASMAASIKPPKTPLQLSMKALSKQLVGVALFFSIVIPMVGFLRGQDLKEMILTGLSLAFATIPEELPIIITMVLGLGAYTLSRRHLLIKKLKAAEALGNTTVIVTDKTGTITENRMAIVAVYPEEKKREVLETAYLAITGISATPMDKAVAEKAEELGLEERKGILRERSFGDGRKTRSILREAGEVLMLYMSGAPEEVASYVTDGKMLIEKQVALEAEKGRRVIAVACKKISPSYRDAPFAELEKDLTFTGLISFEDPARKGVKETILAARTAGIRTIMVTGDHPRTAEYIASDVGIYAGKILTGIELDRLSDAELQETVKEVSVYARTTPENKYRIVKALQKNGEIVAVTGDGVNDTLALKEADIGIAMGLRGTDAAKEAADIVLADDNYVTIEGGIFEGRKFYDNLKKGVKYYLSVKTALVLVFLLPVLLGTPFLFAPIQIIILELFMDLAASSAFVAEPAEKTIYTRPPRNPKENLINKKTLTGILISGASLFAAVWIAYYYASSQNLPLIQIQTYAFTAWITGHLILAYVSRSETDPLYKLGFFSNRIMNYWAALVVIFLAILMYVPVAGTQLRVTQIPIKEIATITLVAFAALFWQEIVKTIKYLKSK